MISLDNKNILPGKNEIIGAERCSSLLSDAYHSGFVRWHPQNTTCTFKILTHASKIIILSQKLSKCDILFTYVHYMFAFETVMIVKGLHFSLTRSHLMHK